MLTLIHPDTTTLKTIRPDELVDLLSQEDLCCEKYGLPNVFVVFPKNVAKAIEAVRSDNTLLIRHASNLNSLIVAMQERLRRGLDAVYRPSHRQMRHYYSTRGFIDTMKRVHDIVGGTVIIPAGIYGSNHYFGLTPQTHNG